MRAPLPPLPVCLQIMWALAAGPGPGPGCCRLVLLTDASMPGATPLSASKLQRPLAAAFPLNLQLALLALKPLQDAGILSTPLQDAGTVRDPTRVYGPMSGARIAGPSHACICPWHVLGSQRPASKAAVVSAAAKVSCPPPPTLTNALLPMAVCPAPVYCREAAAEISSCVHSAAATVIAH